ncbi:CCR4-NOT transcription complex subunit 4 [Babesia sp. Xinjiang]|uniref:CCR4-NOT transcription complex subunit 4 n=1 Tax=Babesia sp. Xinjiang TaxID=462227 RepID=UPI000A22C638|nr:CCR4-NOT transcription complex subunit 4 [Babesia sp. Xinjiang]ORM39808.1 CCR4-NOT transcription complex subunit 4 [Babesia sp. Xinjiang]
MIEGYKKEAHGNNADDEQLCPLCMEPMDETDRNFYPCTCDYQVCLWCLHHLRTAMGNKCPACRRDYEEENMTYNPVHRSQSSTRTQNTKKKREQGEKEATTREENGSPKTRNNDNLKDMRVIQRNLVYVVGIPAKLAKKEILKQHEYFGQYGKIQHMVINKGQTYNAHVGGASYTAYITYSKKTEAAYAIQGIDGSYVNGKLLRASYGTTKYCTFFLKGLKCTNVDCFYLHRYGDESERISKEELSNHMHKAVKTGIGIGTHTMDNATTSKVHSEWGTRNTDHEDLMEAVRQSYDNSLDEENPDTFSEFAINSGLSERDVASWANVTAGMETRNGSTISPFQYIYSHSGDLNLEDVFGEDDFTDDYDFAFDGYKTENSNDDLPMTSAFMNSCMPQYDVENRIEMKPANQNEIMKNLFNVPLWDELQRYNRCDRILYGRDTSLMNESDTGYIRSHDTLGDDLGNEGVSSMQGILWMQASKPPMTQATDIMDKRRQGDLYRNCNQLLSSLDAEAAMEAATDMLGLDDVFTEEVEVDDILCDLQRQQLLLENLNKQYSPDEQKATGSDQVPSLDDKVRQERIDVVKDNAVSVSFAKDRTASVTATPYTERSTISTVDFQVDSILAASPVQDSELLAEIKLFEQMRAHVQKLLDIQRNRDMNFVRYLSQLYAS